MEIFVGTYMRRWLSPCEQPKHLGKNLEMSLFKNLEAVFSFLFLVPMPQKTRVLVLVKLRYYSTLETGFDGERGDSRGVYPKIPLTVKR